MHFQYRECAFSFQSLPPGGEMKIARFGSAIQPIVLVIKPSGRAGRFVGYVGDELIRNQLSAAP